MFNLEVTMKEPMTEAEEIYYDFKTIDSRFAEDFAKGHGLEIMYPADNELFLDIDSPEALAVFTKNRPKFELHIAKIISEYQTVSKSGAPGKSHITLRLDRAVTHEERIIFQSFLGSDQTREVLSYIRLINGDPNPTLFYEKKPQLLLSERTVNTENYDRNGRETDIPYEDGI